MKLAEASTWMMQYYLRPAPDEVAGVIRALAALNALKGQPLKLGLLGRMLGRAPEPASIDMWGSSDAPFIVFFAHVFAQNPARIDGWLDELHALNDAQKRSLWIAVWIARTADTRSILRRRAQKTAKADGRFIEGLLSHEAPVIETVPFLGPVVLDMNWAAFFATGDERFVLRIIAGLGAIAEPEGSPAFAMGTSALWSLLSNAKQQVRVRHVCAKVLAQAQSDSMKSMMETIVNEATKAHASR